jgi:hypothetical protein
VFSRIWFDDARPARTLAGGFKLALIGFEMGLIGFVFLDTEALSLAFLQNNWVCFVISPPIGPPLWPRRSPGKGGA